MGESSIPVDFFNPGQVFACIGFVEAADVLLGDATAAFDWSGDGEFHLRAAGDAQPIRHVLEFLDRATTRTIRPRGVEVSKWNAKWGELHQPENMDYPFRQGDSPSTFVCELTDGTYTLALDHWGDTSGRDPVKFWGGAAGYPGSALARDALALVRGRAAAAADDPFALQGEQGGSFRLDWRRDYIPINLGYSLNNHGWITPIGYPLVELLAAFGLSHARPTRLKRLRYEYGIVGRQAPVDLWFTPSLLRAALGGGDLPFPQRTFEMHLGWAGQEGQARSIQSVNEKERKHGH